MFYDVPLSIANGSIELILMNPGYNSAIAPGGGGDITVKEVKLKLSDATRQNTIKAEIWTFENEDIKSSKNRFLNLWFNMSYFNLTYSYSIGLLLH